MREITDHKVNGCNDQIHILVIDPPGPGGANHIYEVTLPNKTHYLYFQNGGIKDVGVNGVTNEVLLALLIDRLKGFQSGKFACEQNQIALDHIQAAMDALKSRTETRLLRGVEGTLTV